jgi:hypothetical protein
MARFDKYEPLTGGFRALLNADWLVADLNKIVPVSLNASGKIVKGTAGQSGFVGVVCITGRAVDVPGVAAGTNFVGNKKANDVVDVMQDGEIVELTGLIAGQSYFGSADGNTLVPASGTITGLRKIGWTVEATRMIVRCQVAGNVV